MDFSTTRAAGSAPEVTATARQQANSDPTIGSDFDTFLKMLTAQISNQDPLNPMASEEFAVQLATFSGVEQQVRTNELLQALAGELGNDGLGQMAGWIGMEARATMPVAYAGTPVTLSPPQPIAGDRHELVAHDAAGREVWRAPHLPDSGTVDWTGVATDGRPLGAGRYTVTLESFEDARLVATAPVQTYGVVREVRLEPDGAMVIFADGSERPAAEISALRQ
ncbi:flagellar hook capping FlgD N-terminal domain-containing protein [Oceaniglobus trochenteri]|uniref:flagellar hook capping FlgD N-terminal domain-containing protein n=1 Tax=Oceaniglobus trochenteri TaxID=2763260 RepID=UPI001CFF81FF|nr:flagellar hook capping FlgD N-terminal domain-containing protein [Oceaniglobus trochenteri]